MPTPAANDNLSIFHPDSTKATPIDMALYGLDNRGLIADVNHFRVVKSQLKLPIFPTLEIK
jgi:hypothetical protein